MPEWFKKLPAETLRIEPDFSGSSVLNRIDGKGGGAGPDNKLPPTYPVVAMGGTFDHLHSGHKILLSMAAWIAHEKVIVGMTGPFSMQLFKPNVSELGVTPNLHCR